MWLMNHFGISQLKKRLVSLLYIYIHTHSCVPVHRHPPQQTEDFLIFEGTDFLLK